MMNPLLMLKTPLYHGTYKYFKNVNTACGLDYKDFGKGFYLAFDRQQSIDLVTDRAKRESELRQIAMPTRYLFTYQVNYNNFVALCNKGLVMYFSKANIEWLDFIILCRTNAGVPHNYAIVIGPTADDSARFQIKRYYNGDFGTFGSTAAKMKLLNKLKPFIYDTQVFIANELGLTIIDEVNRKEQILK